MTMKQELTLNELLEKIKLQMDPYILLEVLDLEFEELVEHLKDAIEEQYDAFLEELDEDIDSRE